MVVGPKAVEVLTKVIDEALEEEVDFQILMLWLLGVEEDFLVVRPYC